MSINTPAHWWERHDNIVILVDWLADAGYSAREVADAVEKPWKWTDEYRSALVTLEKEHPADVPEDEGTYTPDTTDGVSFSGL